MLLTETYRSLNAQLHAKRPRYGNYGDRHAPEVVTIMRLLGIKTVLDYGCGKARLAAALAKIAPDFKVTNYDPAIEAYADHPAPADMVVCTDVLEHVEPECLKAVLDDLTALAQKAVYLVICTTPDNSKKLPDGTNPHRSVFPASFWVKELAKRFKLTGQALSSTHVQIVGVKK